MKVAGIAVLLSLLLTAGCSAQASESRRFLVLTYNVAGVPSLFKTSQAEVHIPQMSPLLNRFDLVLVQEDFAYHHQLAADVTHPFRSVPAKAVRFVNDGLNRFSRFPFGELHRESWKRCYGMEDSCHDCLADKGFSVGEHQLASGVVVHVYNLHMDAGRARGDHAARVSQVRQLLVAIRTRSEGKAVIVAGDTNLKMESAVDDRRLLHGLLRGAGLQDACGRLGCGTEHYDRILYRSGEGVVLEAVGWEIDERFVDEHGTDLSDHKPVVVEFRWERGDGLRRTELLGTQHNPESRR